MSSSSFDRIAHQTNDFRNEALKLRFKKFEAKQAIERTFILGFITFAMWLVEWINNNIWMKSVFITIAICFLINILHAALLICQLVFAKRPLNGNERQRKLLNIEGERGPFKVLESPPIIRERSEPSKLQAARPTRPNPLSIKMEILASTPKKKFFPPSLTSSSPMLYKDLITDERSLQEYLADYDRKRRERESAELPPHKLEGTIQSNLWKKKVERLLQTSVYQLAVEPSKPESELRKNNNLKWEIFGHLSNEQLGQYIRNLRHWISVTIMKPLINEIDSVNAIFNRLGLKDFRIGESALDHLRSLSSQRKFVSENFHTLPVILDYLEICNNQVYLLERLRCLSNELSNLTCHMDEVAQPLNLPTDATIIFECLCKYLDKQLECCTYQRTYGLRPFHDEYVHMNLVHNRSGCSILYTNSTPPKFHFMTTEKVYSGQYEFNNLFHVLLAFFIYLKSHRHGMLDGVSLGRNGINILWTFGGESH